MALIGCQWHRRFAGAVLVDVKGFSEQDEQSQDLQLEARLAGRTLQLGQSDGVFVPTYPGFQSGFVRLTTVAGQSARDNKHHRNSAGIVN